jgi:two-component system sensor histidine kinase PilS (NtrC family)
MFIVKNSKIPEYLTSRLRWLMLARVFIVTFILGLATFIEVMSLEPLSAMPASVLLVTIVLAYILSILFLVLLHYLPNITLNIYIQGTCDVALVTAMVYATGGIRSIYSVFYPLIIIYAVLFLGRKGGLIIASTAGIFYAFFADFEFYGMIINPVFATADYQLNAGYVFTRIIAHIISFYLIAFLASFVVEQERKTRTLLVEKQTAFDKLDLLHRSIIESVDTGILTVNLKGQIKSLNRAATEITGLSFHKIENQIFSDIFPDCPPLGREQQKAGGNRSPAKTRFEMAFQTGAGRKLLLGGSVSPLKDPSGITIGSIVIFQDLTEINEMKESLEKSRRLAFIGEMAAGLAHEIRNPLASISGSIQMLKGDLTRNDTNSRLMQIILRGKDQLESFLKDFLLMARPAPGVREELDVKETIREVIESVRCISDWNELLEVSMLLADGPLFIQANKTEIRQVVWNLILNAVQAMPEGGVLRVEASPARVGARSGAEIKIGDTGCGIKEQDFQKIYEPFYTTRDTGTGLGLAVVNRIIEAYKGRIHMQSRPGKGTVFTIWLPAQEATAAAEAS